MEFEKLGNDKIPKIVIGTWSWGDGLIGGKGIYGNHLEFNDLKEVFVSAVRNGFTMYDTAPIYSNGESEKIIGQLKNYYDGKVQKTYTINVKGGNARTEILESTLYPSNFDYNSNPILIGKTGSISSSDTHGYIGNLLLCTSPVLNNGKMSDKALACVIMGATSGDNRFNAMNKLIVKVYYHLYKI